MSWPKNIKRKPISEETRLKMRLAKLGKKRSAYECLCLSLAQRGKPKSAKWKEARSHTRLSEETKKKMSEAHKKIGTPWLVGRKHTVEQRKAKSERQKGANSHLWKGGISKQNKSERQLAMETIEYKLWREAVYKRDDFTCKECGVKGGRLNADHIKPWAWFPELRYAIDNGQTLCVSCHQKTPTYGQRTEAFIMSLMK